MTRRSRVFAWALFGAWLAIAAAANLLAWANRPITTDLRELDSVDLVFVTGLTVYTFAFVIVGALVVTRAGHLMGWLLMSTGVAFLVPLLLEQYSLRGLVVAPGSLRAVEYTVWASYLTFTLLWLTPPTLILLLFPTGKPRTPRWRPVLVAVPVAALVGALADAFTPGPMDPGWTYHPVVVTNPFGIEGSAAITQAFSTFGETTSLALLIAGVVSLVLRFRASHGVERQQIKWLVLVGVATVLVIAGIIVANLMAAGTPSEDAVGSIGWGIVVTTLVLGLPLSIGAGVLRYRLYDVDRIISRTFSYAIVTAVLGGSFVLVALIPTAVVGSEDSPDWVIAFATLLVVAAFRPVGRRVQTVVDRRFNRSQYDAERTIEAFTARLREEIDLSALGSELQDVVGRTMQPSHLSLWLRPTSQ